MSVARSCDQCREAKVRCDRAQPSCRRCARRHLQCTGLPSEPTFIFRDENEVARRNSARARREGNGTRPFTPTTSGPSFFAVRDQPQTVQVLRPAKDTFDMTSQYPWLNQRGLLTIPEPLKRDIETRAVERFFINWILYPTRDGAFTGHMPDLPVLYEQTPLDSVLWHAVRAVAFADIRHARSEDVPFDRKARRSYGAALQLVRSIAASNEKELANDNVFAALLVIDSFETVYLARSEPLGPHSDALKYIVQVRGSDQLYSRSSFSLWSIANRRLQSRQILLHEEPDPIQIELLSKLNLDRPDLRICADTLQMTTLSAKARRLMRGPGSPGTATAPTDTMNRSTRLLDEMRRFIAESETWTSEVDPVWKPKVVDASPIVDPTNVEYPPDHPLAALYCPSLIAYPDIWMGFIWNFHAACMIVLRESFIELIEHRVSIRGEEPSEDDSGSIEINQVASEQLSSSIIRSFPRLMGFTEKGSPPIQGLMAGRCLALFAMDIVRKARFASPGQKGIAVKVVEWMSSMYALD